MHWKLKENIRLGKICSSCRYGSYLNTITNQYAKNPDFGLCCKNMGCLENDWEGDDDPDIAPRIRTCRDWKSIEENEESNE